jgi:hypothetical protein
MRKLGRTRWQSGRSSIGLLVSPTRQLIIFEDSVTYLDILEYAEIRLGVLSHEVKLELGALDTTQDTLEDIADIASFLTHQHSPRPPVGYLPMPDQVQVLIEPNPA